MPHNRYHTGSTTTTTGGGAKKKPTSAKPTSRVLSTLDQFDAAVKAAGLQDYSFFELLQSPFFTGPGAYTLAPALYGQIQQHYLNKERETGKPFIDMLGGSSEQAQADGSGGGRARSGSGGGGGGGGGAAAMSAQEEFDWRERAANADQQRQLELERIREENAMRRQKLSEAGQFARTAAEVQGNARRLIAELTGVDPVRGAIAQGGGVQRGTTPAQGFMGQLQGISNAPIPQVNENASIPELQTIIDSLKNQGQLPVAPALGFAGGGTIDMYGADAGIQFGTQKRAVRLGEGTGTGEEIGIIDPARGDGITEVIPMVGGAAEGGTFDANTIKQALSRVYGSLGFSDFPTASRSEHGFSTPTSYGSLGTAKRLGYSPRLVRNYQTGEVYFGNPEGALQKIASQDVFDRSGFKWSDVFNVTPDEIAGQQFGADLGAPPPLIEGPARRFSTMATPLVEPTTGMALPDPAQIAAIWRFLDPDTQKVLQSAYGVSGLGSDSIGSRMQFATPRGSATSYGGARLG